MTLLTFDFGGTSVKYTLWQKDRLLNVSSFPTPTTWDETKKTLLEIKSDYEKSHVLNGVAFSFPGCVEQENGVILGYSAIPYIHHFPIKQELSELLQLPISLENDANCAALAEVWSGVAKGAKDVLFVVVGTGVGGAVVVDGKIHSGAHLYGGEFGYMYLDYEGKYQHQTLSGLGTAVCMAQRYCDSINVPHGTHSGKDVFAFAIQGDEKAAEQVEIFFRYLSVGLFNLQLSLDPEIIVIGGGISANSEIITELEVRVNKLIEVAHIKDFKVQLVPCYYKNDANLIGAVKNFYSRMEADL